MSEFTSETGKRAVEIRRQKEDPERRKEIMRAAQRVSAANKKLGVEQRALNLALPLLKLLARCGDGSGFRKKLLEETVAWLRMKVKAKKERGG
jgi:hypothetical protein